MATSMRPYLLVAAIDFGTTYSGYAFSFRNEYEKDPCKISANAWNAGSRSLVSLKAPTCALFDPNKRFHSFGFEAEEKYADLAADGEARDWYYFRRFKMTLYNKITLKRNFDLEADGGRKLPAMSVFSSCLKYLVDHLFKTCQDRISGIERTDIRWVLTVPAIWNDAAKQFMREAAEKAEIPGDQLLIALEPEAASIFCQHLPIKMLSGTEGGFQPFQLGSKYIVLDAGARYKDTCYHCQEEGRWSSECPKKVKKEKKEEISEAEEKTEEEPIAAEIFIAKQAEETDEEPISVKKGKTVKRRRKWSFVIEISL